MAQLNFDSNTIEDSAFEEVEPGEYVACVISSDVTENKNQNGIVAKMQLEILEGASKGRRVFANFNTRHENPKAETIGNQGLKSLCVACGKPIIEDTVELHDIPIRITVGKQRNDPSRTEIKKYVAIKQVSEGTTTSSRPWARA